MNRWKAAGTHLALSVFIIGGIALTAFLLWYPMGLYKVAGLDRLLLVMLGIDLTAGPLLTLILYREGKWGLKFDLATVALAQLAFLAYGLNTLRLSRPVFLVGTPDVFTLVFASEIDEAELKLAPKPEWRRLSWTGPELVGTRMPDEPEARKAVIDEFMAGGAGIERAPKYYRELSEVASFILPRAKSVRDAKGLGPAALRIEGRSEDSVRVMPIVSRRGEGLLLVDAQTAEPIRTVARERGDSE